MRFFQIHWQVSSPRHQSCDPQKYSRGESFVSAWRHVEKLCACILSMLLADLCFRWHLRPPFQLWREMTRPVWNLTAKNKKGSIFTGESAGPLGPPSSGTLPSVLLFDSLDILIFHNGCFGSYWNESRDLLNGLLLCRERGISECRCTLLELTGPSGQPWQSINVQANLQDNESHEN